MKKQSDYVMQKEQYRKSIVEMIEKIDNERYLRRIYIFVNGFLEQDD